MAAFKVSVIGAGQVGATTALRVAENNLADVSLIDIVEGMPQGKALDLMQSSPAIGRGATIEGANDLAAAADSDLVVVTAGLPRKPGMSREELLTANADIVAPIAEKLAEIAPESIIVVVSNPLDIMTCLAWKKTGFPSERVMGMAGVLDASRFACFVAQELGICADDVRATVLGGHGDSMVLLPRYSSVSGIPLPDLIPADRLNELVERARNGGAEIVSLLKTGSAYYAPSASVYAMVESILLDRRRIFCASALMEGQYGLEDVYIGAPVTLGTGGVEEIIELKLTEDESAALRKSADVVKNGVETLRKAGKL